MEGSADLLHEIARARDEERRARSLRAFAVRGRGGRASRGCVLSELVGAVRRRVAPRRPLAV